MAGRGGPLDPLGTPNTPQSDNFTGAPVDGYNVNRTAGTLELAAALSLRRANGPRGKGPPAAGLGRLPPPAGRQPLPGLVRRAQRTAGRSKGTIPTSTRAQIVPLGYVAARSGHSRGSAVDLTLARGDGSLLDMGGCFDLMDEMSHHGAPVAEPAARNRLLLKADYGRKAGLQPYECEWWHYSLVREEPYPDTYFDFPLAVKGAPGWVQFWGSDLTGWFWVWASFSGDAAPTGGGGQLRGCGAALPCPGWDKSAPERRAGLDGGRGFLSAFGGLCGHEPAGGRASVGGGRLHGLSSRAVWPCGGVTAGAARTRTRDLSLENPIGCRAGFVGLTGKHKRYKLCAGEIYA